MAYAFKRGKSFYISFRDETGKWVQRSTDAKTMTEAKRLASEKEIRDERIRLGLDHSYPSMTFRALAEKYLTGVVPSRRSFKTIEGRIRNHLMPTFGDKHIAQILAHDINALLLRKRDEGLSIQTVKHLRDTLRAMYRYALANRWLDPRVGSPVVGVDKEIVKVPKSAPKSLTPDQALGMLDYAHPRWVNYFALLIYTALRKQEGLLLERDDVHLEERYLLIRKTKTRMYRKVPIPLELVPYLKAQLAMMPPGEKLLFGKVRPDIKLEKVMRTALKYAGVTEHFCLKDLRSTHATLAAEATGDARYVQSVLGHTDMNVTNDRYMKFRLKWALRKADKFSLLNHQYEEDEVTAS